MIERAPGSIDEPLVVIIMSFLPKDTLKFHAKYHTLAPSQSPKYYSVMWVETTTAAGVFHNLSHTYGDDWKSF